MTDGDRLKYLQLALRLVGAIAIFGIYPLTVLWPSGWAWSAGRSEYLEMIIAIYATLGVFLIIAARALVSTSDLYLSLSGRASCMAVSWPFSPFSTRCMSITCSATYLRYLSLPLSLHSFRRTLSVSLSQHTVGLPAALRRWRQGR